MRWPVAVAATFIALCGAPASAAPPAKVLTFADSGTTVTLAPGQRLRIRLDVCYSCGYRWATRRAPNPRVLRRQRQRNSGGCKPPCTGGTAVTIFRYVARAQGSTKLRLGYLPPGRSKPKQAFRLRVHVR